LLRRSLGVALVAGAVVAGGCGGPDLGDTGADSLPFDGRSPLVPPAKETRVLIQLRRPSLAEAGYRGGARRRAYVASLQNEVRALRSAQEAKGVALRHPRVFARVWNGFAATIDTGDLPKLQALGLRVEPVRRFYPAAAAAVGVDSSQLTLGRASRQPAVALLDSTGAHGAAIRRVLGDLPVLPIPVAGPRRDPASGARTELGTTDQLLAGLERAVDPNGDGDTADHVPIALVGVNSPYAGFADSPEAVASGAARALGTLVIAPAGNEGPGAGTVGSPAAAPGVLAVAALEGGDAAALPEIRIGLAASEGRSLLHGTLLGGTGHVLRAEIETLEGPSQASPHASGRALGGSPLEYFAVDATNRAKGKVVVVPAGANGGPPLAARAAAAAEAGAAALVVCEPDESRPLTAITGTSASMPVIGLHGPSAARALDLTSRGGGLAFLSAPRARNAPGAPTPAPASSRGPTYALAPKPDISAPGTARIASSGTVVAGTSVAAARVAAAAVAVRARNPAARPDDVGAALVGTAHRVGPTLAAGAGRLDPAAAPEARILVEPSALALPRQPAGAPFAVSRTVTVTNAGPAATRVNLAALLRGADVNLFPPKLTLQAHARKRVTVTVSAAGRGNSAGFVTGRIVATGAGPPVATVIGLPIGPPPPARLGALTLAGAAGVRFTAGSVTERAGARAVEPLGKLDLQLVDANGKVVRQLTPRGGAVDLLPGEYAYTLTRSARRALSGGRYSFRARGRGPAGGPVAVRKSPSFTPR
jgi:Subtilase family